MNRIQQSFEIPMTIDFGFDLKFGKLLEKKSSKSVVNCLKS